MTTTGSAERSLLGRSLRWIGALLILLIVAASVLLFVAARREYTRRTNLYWYDVEADQELQLSSADERARVEVSREGFRWPVGPDACDTALLRLAVDSTVRGRWFEPVVRVEGAGLDAFEQHFERGARGQRYVNLSPLCGHLTVGDPVGLGGRHLAWEPQGSDLLLFRNPERDREPILVLAPHPDDAEIAAFGLYSSRRSVVATVTAGDDRRRGFEHLVSDVDEQRRLRGRLRAWDSVAVPAWGGVRSGDALNLGYLSGLLETMHDRPQTDVGAEHGGTRAVRSFRRVGGSPFLEEREPTSSWSSLVDDLAALVRGVAPALRPPPTRSRSAIL